MGASVILMCFVIPLRAFVLYTFAPNTEGRGLFVFRYHEVIQREYY